MALERAPATITVANVMGRQVTARQVAAGRTIADSFIEEFPSGFPGFTVVPLEGRRHLTDAECCARVIAPGEHFTLAVLPQGPLVLGVPLGFWILAAVSLVASFLLAPAIPNLTNQEFDEPSGTAFIANQQNRLRPGSRVPDVFGRFRVWPDLVAPGYSIFEKDKQTLFELFVVTNGFGEILEPKLQDDDIDTLESSFVQVLAPDAPLPPDFKLVSQNQVVGNTPLIAPNEETTTGLIITVNSAESRIEAPSDIWADAVAAGVLFLGGTSDPANETLYTVTGSGDDGSTFWVEVSPAPASDEAGFNIFWQAVGPAGVPRKVTSLSINTLDTFPNVFQHDGEYLWGADNLWTIGTGENVGFNAAGAEAAGRAGDSVRFLQFVEFPGRDPGTFHRVNKSGDAKLSNPEGVAKIFPKVVQLVNPLPAGLAIGDEVIDIEPVGDQFTPVPDEDALGFRNWSKWFAVPGTESTEIWWDIAFQKGLYEQAAGKAPITRSVDLMVQYRRDFGGGTFDAVVTITETYTAKTRNQARYTRKITGLTPGRYQARFRRATDAVLDNASLIAPDDMTLAMLAGVKDHGGMTLGDCTAVFLNFNTADLSAGAQNRRFNCICQRWLPTFDSEAGEVVETLAPSSKIADAILYTAVNQGRYAADKIDLARLYELQDTLDQIDSGRGGEFNGVFDQQTGVDDQIARLADLGRLIAYRRAATIFFYRDEPRTLPVTILNQRNKLRPETKTMAYADDDEIDGVEVTFRDSRNGFEESTEQWPTGITLLQAKRITLEGATYRETAIRRARFEWDRHRLIRDALEVESTEESTLLEPGDLVAITDHLKEIPPVAGEVVAIAGPVVTIDQEGPASGGPFVLRLRSDEGDTVEQFNVVSIAGADITLAGSPSFTIPTSGQVGLLYQLIDAAAAPASLASTVSVKPDRDGTVTLRLVNYDAEIYAADTMIVGPAFTAGFDSGFEIGE